MILVDLKKLQNGYEFSQYYITTIADLKTGNYTHYKHKRLHQYQQCIKK